MGCRQCRSFLNCACSLEGKRQRKWSLRSLNKVVMGVVDFNHFFGCCVVFAQGTTVTTDWIKIKGHHAIQKKIWHSLMISKSRACHVEQLILSTNRSPILLLGCWQRETIRSTKGVLKTGCHTSNLCTWFEAKSSIFVWLFSQDFLLV